MAGCTHLLSHYAAACVSGFTAEKHGHTGVRVTVTVGVTVRVGVRVTVTVSLRVRVGVRVRVR